MAMYIFSNLLDIHLFISCTFISVILNIVDLLYLLWNNFSSISAILLVDTTFEIPGYNKIIYSRNSLISVEESCLEFIVPVPWNMKMINPSVFCARVSFIISISHPMGFFKECLDFSLEEILQKILCCLSSKFRYFYQILPLLFPF